MDDIRVKTVTAVALCVVIPMLIVVHLVDRYSAGTLDSPWAVVILFVLGLVLVGIGLSILNAISPPVAAPEAPTPVAPDSGSEETPADS